MSNKTQLQTNNTNLDSLITRVNAAKDVAASLPEAGGGGSSGGVEMCTVTLKINSPAFGDFTVYHTNSDLQVITTTMPGSVMRGTFQAAKGTIIAVTPWEFMTEDSNQIFKSAEFGVWVITEDCTIGFDG